MLALRLVSLLTWAGLLASGIPLNDRDSSSPTTFRLTAANAIYQWDAIGKPPALGKITYKLHLRARDDAGLDARMLEIVNSNGEWLSFEKLKEFVAPAEGTKQHIRDALPDVDSLTFDELGDTVTVESTIAHTEQLFAASFEIFAKTTGTDKQASRVRTRSYTVPAALEPYVIGVSPFLDFFEQPQPLSQRRLRGQAQQAQEAPDPRDTSGDLQDCEKREVTTPECQRTLYGLRGFTPKSTDLAMGVVAYAGVDVHLDDFGLLMAQCRPEYAAYRPGVIQQPGVEDFPLYPPIDNEIAMDASICSAIVAPAPCNIYVLKPENNDYFATFFDYFIHLPRTERPAILSFSWGNDENGHVAADAQIICKKAKQLTALGTTIFIGAGDNGVFGIQPATAGDTCPPFVATFPICSHIVSVGGTQHLFHEEPATEDFGGYSSGGGFSAFTELQWWQKVAVHEYERLLGGAEKGNYNAHGRGFPDLSTTGARMPYVYNGTVFPQYGGGTSASTPLTASIFSLLNSARRAKGMGPVGWVHPRLYAAAPSIFRDIQRGSITGCVDANNKTHGLPATKDWDAASGLGSLSFPKLRAAFDAD